MASRGTAGGRKRGSFIPYDLAPERAEEVVATANRYVEEREGITSLPWEKKYDARKEENVPRFRRTEDGIAVSRHGTDMDTGQFIGDVVRITATQPWYRLRERLQEEYSDGL